MSAWKPIQTAPRDGRDILLFEATASGPYLRVGYWESCGTDIEDMNRTEGWSLADQGYIGEIEPTHWQQLPEPPDTQSISGECDAER